MATITDEECGMSTESQQREQLMGPAEVAEFLGIPVATLYAWRYRQTGPPSLRVGRHLRYRRADVIRWLDKQALGPR
jgi:excisionase family DNA binding protein